MTSSIALLNRETFKTSRQMDFFSVRELTTQTGHDIGEWPLVFLKELLDNALDACEEADIAPVITVTADACGITVSDNGLGIPEETIAGQLNFAARSSSREMYVAPDRGAQGNALKTLLAMPYVVDPDHGRLVVIAKGVRHEIVCRADPISQQPLIEDKKSASDNQGTTIRIEWQEQHDDDDVVWPFNDVNPQSDGSVWQPSLKDQVARLLHGYALFNPHLHLRVEWFDKTLIDAGPTDISWCKWKPNKPTNALWYDQQHFGRLIAAYITMDRDRGKRRPVSEFVAEFDGFSGTKKRKEVLEETELVRTQLEELATEDGLRYELIAKLLTAMQARSKEVKPARLGVIGKHHLQMRFEELGCSPEQFEYTKIARVDDGMPFVVETAFGWLGKDAEDRRHFFPGVNWSSSIKNPFRNFGETGVGLESLLNERKAGVDEPVLLALHLSHPRIQYTDRGKSAIVIESDGTEGNHVMEDLK